jgi:hypothetical protein
MPIKTRILIIFGFALVGLAIGVGAYLPVTAEAAGYTGSFQPIDQTSNIRCNWNSGYYPGCTTGTGLITRTTAYPNAVQTIKIWVAVDRYQSTGWVVDHWLNNTQPLVGTSYPNQSVTLPSLPGGTLGTHTWYRFRWAVEWWVNGSKVGSMDFIRPPANYLFTTFANTQDGYTVFATNQGAVEFTPYGG